jgi:hypothetical protein
MRKGYKAGARVLFMNENVKLHLAAITSGLYDLHLALLNIPAAA